MFKEAHMRLHYHWVAHSGSGGAYEPLITGEAHMSHPSEEWLICATM